MTVFARSAAPATIAVAAGGDEAEITGPGGDIGGVTLVQLGDEVAGIPEVLHHVQPAGRLLPGPHAAEPAPAGLEPGAGHPVGALEREAVGGDLDRGRPVAEALTVHVTPGAKGLQLEPHRARRPHDAVHDAHRRPAVHHGQLALDDDVAQVPAPARDASAQREAREQPVAGGRHRAVGPLVGRQPDALVADHDDRVQGGEAQAPADGRLRGHDEQPVVPPGPQTRDRAHRVAAQPVGHEPLPPAGRLEAPADLAAGGDDGG